MNKSCYNKIMQEVKSITLLLENCETIKIGRKYIGAFRCSDIKTNVERIAMNSISKHQKCKEFYIEINKGANKHYSSFGRECKQTIFERLQASPDITLVCIEYTDGTTDDIFVPWSTENEWNNAFQTSYISKQGHMHILVSKKKTIKDVLDLSEVDDPEVQKSYWQWVELD